jgi:imidazolonepropionase-like amidohydrolase
METKLENVRMLHEAGVVVLAGTDLGNPFLVPGVSLHDELAALVEGVGLSPLEALRAATVDPARVFGMADSLGTVAEGMLADLVLLGSNPLENISNTMSVVGVVLNGRLLDRDALDSLLSGEAAGRP